MTNGVEFDSIELMETTQGTLDHLIQENPMGEARKDALRLVFNQKLKLEFHGTKVTSDGGLLAYRELDDALGLTSVVDSELRDIRAGKNTQHGLTAFLRRLALPKSVKQWSLRTLRDKLIKIGAKVVSHSRYMIFQMAEVAVPQTPFREILDRIRQLRFLGIPVSPG